MHKLTFTLKQHTPIIHFQHEQHGATLRATELKPKLDKFLIEKLNMLHKVERNNKIVIEPKPEFKDWFINYKSKQNEALDYKVRILANSKTKQNLRLPNAMPKFDSEKRKDLYTAKNYPNFFAHMKVEKSELKDFSLYGEVTVEFSSFNVPLKNKIKEFFSEFIAITNFGTRQSKGFGCFIATKLIVGDEVIHQTFNENWFDYKTEIKAVTVKEVFDKIEIFYKAVRSGINLKKPIKENDRVKKDQNGVNMMKSLLYMKPVIFLYFKAKNIQWEKKTIKENFFNNDKRYPDGNTKYYGLETQIENLPTSETLITSLPNKKIIKDLLGLSSEETWNSYGKATITKKESKLNNFGAVCIDSDGKPIDIDNANIDRFKSPITFVPVKSERGYSLFIKFNEEISIQGKWFNIKNKSNAFPLQVAENFSLDSFFEFITTHFKIKENYTLYDKQNNNAIFTKDTLIETFSNLTSTK